MDVSFNNVLESTRQYFQGLPANSPTNNNNNNTNSSSASGVAPPQPSNAVAAAAGAVAPPNLPGAATPVQPPAPLQPQHSQPQRPPSVPSSSPSVLSYWPPAPGAALRNTNTPTTNTAGGIDQAQTPAQVHHHQLQSQSHYTAAAAATKAHRSLYNGARTATSTPTSDVTIATPPSVATATTNQRHNLPPIAALSSSVNYASSRSAARDSSLASSLLRHHQSQQQQQQQHLSPLPSISQITPLSSRGSSPQQRSHFRSPDYLNHQTTPYSANNSSPLNQNRSLTTTNQYSAQLNHHQIPKYSQHSTGSTNPNPTSVSYSMSSVSSSAPTSSSLPTPAVSAHSSIAYPHLSAASYPPTPSSRYQTSQQYNHHQQQQAAAVLQQQQQQQQQQQHYQNALYQHQQQQQQQHHRQQAAVQSQSAEMAKADQHYRNQMAAAASLKAGRHYPQAQQQSHHAQQLSQQQQAYYSSSGNAVRSSHSQQPQQPSAPLTTIANNNNQPQTMTSQSRSTGLMKRESPLDLSVKTVRQSADSTAKDESESYHSSMSGFHHHEMLQHNRTKTPPKSSGSRGSAVLPSMQLPSSILYPPFSNQDQPPGDTNGNATATAGAPKVDFLPNFSAPHQNNYQGNASAAFTPEPKKRSRKSSVTQPIISGQYSNSYQNAAMANASLKKAHNSLPSSLYDYHNMNSKQNSYYQSSNTSQSKPVAGQNRNGNAPMYTGMSADAAYLLDVKQFQQQTRLDYLNQQALSNQTAESNYPSNKRASTTDLNNPRQAKIPKVDLWKQKFDQEIDQRINSYASSKLMNEQQQQQHLNGVAAKDSSNVGVIQHQNYAVYAQQMSQSRYQSSSLNQIPPNSSSQSVSNHNKHPMYAQPLQSVIHSSSGASGNSYSMNPLYSTAAMKTTHDSYHQAAGRLPMSGNTGAANKQVLSILRNSLEIREARNLQIQQQQQQQQQERSFVPPTSTAHQEQQHHYQQPAQQILHHRGKSYYPLEPILRMQQPQATIPGPPPQNTSSAQSKPPAGVPSPTPPPTGRHNLPPFGAIAVDRTTTSTPPYPGYKFHVPKAIDSVLLDDHHHTSADGARLHRGGGGTPTFRPPSSLEAASRSTAADVQPPPPLPPPGSDSPTATEMDGLAAFLAARIRTKAELKQVGPGILGSTASAIPGSNGSVNSPRATPGIFSPLPAPACTPDIAKGGPSEGESAAGGSSGNLGSASSVSTTASPPKLTRERGALISPRRRLFSRSDEEIANVLASTATNATATSLPPVAVTAASSSAVTQLQLPQAIPARDVAPRSSSEASVFDFRESDSESEMPVLERQTLHELRRDRRSGSAGGSSKTSAAGQPHQSTSQADVPEEPPDPFWSATCDDFLSQLQTGKCLLKRRGRRKKKRIKSPPPPTQKPHDPPPPQPKPEKPAKTEPTVEVTIKKEKSPVKEEKSVMKIKKETVVKEEKKEVFKEEKQEVFREEKKEVVKEEKKEVVEEEKKNFICDKILEVKAVKLELGESSDEDIPLSKRKCEIQKTKTVIKEEPQEKEVCESEDPSSEEEEENVTDNTTSSRRLRERKTHNRSVSEEKDKQKQSKKQPRSLSPPKRQKEKPKKFGDGSKFTPGWEEDLLKYKKSLRMPARLITISRPVNWPRASASLPDLDPPLPPDSPLTCDSDMFSSKKTDSIDESTPAKKTGSNKAIVPVKAKSPSKEEDSFLNRLVQRYGGKGKKSIRKAVSELLDTSDRKPKKIEKSSDGPELLPTPRLDQLVKTPGKKLAEVETKVVVKKTRGRKPKKDKEVKEDTHCDNDNNALYLGYFRKKTVAEFREAFEKHNGAFVGENDLPPVVYESRTRTQTRVLKQQATIREVFGDDRPASAPPAACRGDEADEKLEDTAKKPGRRKLGITKLVLRKRGNSNANLVGNRPGLRSAAQLRSSKAVLNSKRQLLHGDQRRKRNSDLLKAFASGKKQLEFITTTTTTAKTKGKLVPSSIDDSLLPPPPTDASGPHPLTVETSDNNAFSEVQPTMVGKKLKLRRKLKSSGFDYIRKKKKQQQRRDGGEMEPPKEKRKSAFSVTKSGVELEQDIQNEIKGWVINKGLGETVLHRAARLGYTEVVAYCLEKLNNNPSPRDNAGYTPLYEACSRNHIEIARLLLLFGANPSDSAQGGIRLLHEAAENGFVEVMRMLLSYGADPLLATYAGHTPLSLATSEDARALLQHHLADVQGHPPAPPWHFNGPASIFDVENSGNDPVADAPEADEEPGRGGGEEAELVVEWSEEALPPNLYTLHDEEPSDRWVLFQEVCSALRIKTRDALLRQLGPNHKNDFRDMKLTEFYDQARCCMLMGAGDHLVNPRAHKVILVKYTDQLRSLLKIERDTIPIS